MVHTAKPIDFSERLRSLSMEQSSPGGPCPLAGSKRPYLITAALIGTLVSGTVYAVITDSPLIAHTKEAAYTVWDRFTGLSAPAQNHALADQSVDAQSSLPTTNGRPAATPNQASVAVQGPVVLGSGYSRAQRDVTLTASRAGRIAEIDVTDGADVTAGSVLLKLDDRQAREKLSRSALELQSRRLELDQAKLTLAQHREDTARVRKLTATGALPRTQESDANHDLAQRTLDFKRAEAAVRLAMADTDAAKAGLKDYVLRAPFDGRVSALTAQVGQRVHSDFGEALLRVFDPKSIVVDVDVDDRNLRDITPGQAATLVFDAWSDVEVPGTVARLSPLVSKERGTVRLTLSLAAFPPGIRPNMAVRAAIITAANPTRLSSNRENANEHPQ